jgi:hypothetical protein
MSREVFWLMCWSSGFEGDMEVRMDQCGLVTEHVQVSCGLS